MSGMHPSAQDVPAHPVKRRRQGYSPGESRAVYVEPLLRDKPSEPVNVWADDDGEAPYWLFESRHKGEYMRMYMGRKGRVPDGVENCCPITLEPFDVNGVTFLEGKHFVPEDPDLCVGVLPCGHAFGAMNITYYMASSTMRCPVCRAGLNKKMKDQSIPKHIRSEIKEKVKANILEEREEMERQDAEVARSVLLEGGIMELISNGLGIDVAEEANSFMDNHFPITMTVYLMGQVSRSVISYRDVADPATGVVSRRASSTRVIEDATFDQREIPLFSIGGMMYIVQELDVRYVMSYIDQSNSTSMRITIHTRDRGNLPADVSNSEMLNFSDLGRSLEGNAEGISIPCHGGALYFNLRPPQDGVDPLNARRQFLTRVCGVRWTADQTVLSSVLDTSA